MDMKVFILINDPTYGFYQPASDGATEAFNLNNISVCQRDISHASPRQVLDTTCFKSFQGQPPMRFWAASKVSFDIHQTDFRPPPLTDDFSHKGLFIHSGQKDVPISRLRAWRSGPGQPRLGVVRTRIRLLLTIHRVPGPGADSAAANSQRRTATRTASGPTELRRKITIPG